MNGIVPGRTVAEQPCSVKIFMLDGSPDGVRIANVGMSAIEAIAFRRTRLGEVSKHGRDYEGFPKIDRTGVYILIGADENESGRLPAYIGESENVGSRLSTHVSQSSGRDFWTHTIALFSRDESLTKGHARYVERQLIEAAQDNPRWEIQNKVSPLDQAGKLQLSDRSDMERFIHEAKILVGALGWDLFHEKRKETKKEALLPKESAPSQSPVFSAESKGAYSAKMIVNEAGDFVVKAGSKGRGRTTKGLQAGYLRERRILMEAGFLREEGDFIVFVNECVFSSASMAGAIVRGSNVNGRDFWRLPGGQTYAQWEADQTPPD